MGKVVTSLSLDEHIALKRLARRNRVRIGEYVRAIVIDAIAEDGEPDVIQPIGTQRCTQG